MPISLQDIMRIDNPELHKLHLACRYKDGTNPKDAVHPLDEYIANSNNWVRWNQWRGQYNSWTRDCIFSLMEFYPRTDAWLFGGVFHVLERRDDPDEYSYELEEVGEYSKYVGRVIFSFHRTQGMRRRDYCLEKYINEFELAEILPTRYSGESFPGYENINHDFNVLEPIFRSEQKDWCDALSRIKGVYLISDKHNGKQYVGSAYGDMGIWSRWACYIGTGHGWNDALTALITEKTIEYARKNFRFSLLEIMSMSTSDETIIARESRWKNALLTRECGYNNN